jgi:hypothetical protein
MDEYCCNSFKKIALTFSWMSFHDNKNESILCMPYILSENIRYRINHCPSCGREIRSIEIPASKLSKF